MKLNKVIYLLMFLIFIKLYCAEKVTTVNFKTTHEEIKKLLQTPIGVVIHFSHEINNITGCLCCKRKIKIQTTSTLSLNRTYALKNLIEQIQNCRDNLIIDTIKLSKTGEALNNDYSFDVFDFPTELFVECTIKN